MTTVIPVTPVTTAPTAPTSGTSRTPCTLYDADPSLLADILQDQPPYRVGQVWRAMHRQARWPEEMTDLPVDVRERLGKFLPRGLSPLDRLTGDGGETVKWLWALNDGPRVESVLMRYPDRVTVCVSSQAGCAMGCTFCATGQAGFTRQLTAGEMVEQVIAAQRECRPRRLSGVVFMGMGEPLANFNNLWGALVRLHEEVGLSARHLTVSTVGIVPGMRRLTAGGLPVNLAVSLHAARDELRDELVPMNRRYPLRSLMGACEEWVERTHRRLSFEWAMIGGVNDTPRDAAELAALALPLRAHVNLIPLNPTSGYSSPATGTDGVGSFAHLLRARGVNVTVRATKGADIAAACGQLAGA